MDIEPTQLLWTTLEGENDQLHCFKIGHVPDHPLVAYEPLCKAPGVIRFAAFKEQTKCEVCERKRAQLIVIEPDDE